MSEDIEGSIYLFLFLKEDFRIIFSWVLTKLVFERV